MATVQQIFEMDIMSRNQRLMQRIHEAYDSRIGDLLQQKGKIVMAIQQLMDHQMHSLLDSVLLKERGLKMNNSVQYEIVNGVINPAGGRSEV